MRVRVAGLGRKGLEPADCRLRLYLLLLFLTFLFRLSLFYTIFYFIFILFFYVCTDLSSPTYSLFLYLFLLICLLLSLLFFLSPSLFLGDVIFLVLCSNVPKQNKTKQRLENSFGITAYIVWMLVKCWSPIKELWKIEIKSWPESFMCDDQDRLQWW